MTTLLTVNTVVYPDVEYTDTETAFLQPLVVTICFSGPVPRRLIQTDIVRLSLNLIFLVALINIYY